MLVDCSRFLPGSRNLAASYNLGCFHRHHVADFSAFRRQDVNEAHETHEAHDDVLGRPSDVIDPTTDSGPVALFGSYRNTVMCDSGLRAGNGIGIASVWSTPAPLPSTKTAIPSALDTSGQRGQRGSPTKNRTRRQGSSKQVEQTAGRGDSGTQDRRTAQHQAKWINSSTTISSNDSSSGVSVSRKLDGDDQCVSPALGTRSRNILQSRSSAEVGRAGVGARSTEEYCAYLCRYNAAVATGCGYPEQASFWALLAIAVDKEACSRQNASSCSLVGARWHAGWKGTASRSIEKALRYFENIGDPQMLASMVCVLGCASKGGGYGTLLPQGQENVAKYDRYLASYAEQLYQWSAHRVRTEIISHIRGGSQKLFSSQGNRSIAETSVCDQGVQDEGWLCCSLCGKPVGFAAPTCGLCGHGGHSLHMKSWFATESECPYDGCKCLCWMEVQGEWDDVIT